MSDYSTNFTADASPAEAYNSICNVRGWWSGEIEGETDRQDAEFTYTVPGVHYSRQRIAELQPGKRIVWNVIDANLSFATNKEEWKGSRMIFDLEEKAGKTQVHFTHEGLVPANECYKDCSNAWGLLINGNLKRLIETGEVQGMPW